MSIKNKGLKGLKHVMSNAVPDKRDHNYMEQHKHCLLSSLYTDIEYPELGGSLIHNGHSQNKSLFIFTHSPHAVSLNEVNVLKTLKRHLLQNQEQF